MGMPPGTSILPIVTSLSLVAIVDRRTGEIMRTNISSVPSLHEGGGRAVPIFSFLNTKCCYLFNSQFGLNIVFTESFLVVFNNSRETEHGIMINGVSNFFILSLLRFSMKHVN